MALKYYFIKIKPDQYSKIKSFRKKIFVKEDHYPGQEIWQDYDDQAVHFFLMHGRQIAGVVSLYSNVPLPIEKYISLNKYKGKSNVEIYKLALAKEYRNTFSIFFLMKELYEYLKKNNFDMAFIHSLKNKVKNIKFYKKIGFKSIGEVEHPNKGLLDVLYCTNDMFNIENVFKKYEIRHKNQ